jgi:hypothetical protein
MSRQELLMASELSKTAGKSPPTAKNGGLIGAKKSPLCSLARSHTLHCSYSLHLSTTTSHIIAKHSCIHFIQSTRSPRWLPFYPSTCGDFTKECRENQSTRSRSRKQRSTHQNINLTALCFDYSISSQQRWWKDQTMMR